MQHISIANSTRLEMKLNLNDGSVLTMNFVAELIPKAKNGAYDFTKNALIKGRQTINCLIADSRKKHMAFSHYRAHLSAIDFWLEYFCDKVGLGLAA